MRISKVYTKTGDDGTTGIVGNVRLSKGNARIHAIGDVDELNSWIGVLRSEQVVVPDLQFDVLHDIQNDLFNVGGELAMPPEILLKEERVALLEQEIDHINLLLPPLTDFILPHGDNGVCFIHVARSVCRRAERSLVALNSEEFVSDTAMRYINRLSDFLFVLARLVDLMYNEEDEELWEHEKQKRD
jgi:cob(I)alamin adenosyltransferase